MTKKIYYEPAGKTFSYHKSIIFHPPEGYEFIIPKGLWYNIGDKSASILSSNNYHIGRLLRKFNLPWHFIKSWMEGFLIKPPKEACLTFAWNHLVFRKEPWIVQVEWPEMLTGWNYTAFRVLKGRVEKALASSYCRKILTWSNVAKNSFFPNLNCTKFEHKIEVVPLAVPKKDFVKDYNDDKVKLLFIGSSHVKGNLFYNFDSKGGKEVLEAFFILNEKFKNLELVIRTEVPQQYKERCQAFKNIKLIEKPISWEELEQEYKTADIFLFPGHHTPFGVILEAMSYELPVIATDVYGNRELVKDGVTGFIIRSSEKVPYYWGDSTLPWMTARRQVWQGVQTIDPKVVQDLVEKASILIEDKKLRRRMGKAGRWEVEEGEHSIKQRNKILKRIFDEATTE